MYILSRCPETIIVEQEGIAIAKQRCDKHISMAVNKHAAIEELLGTESVYSPGPEQN
jgi:hypothetical protein